VVKEKKKSQEKAGFKKHLLEQTACNVTVHELNVIKNCFCSQKVFNHTSPMCGKIECYHVILPHMGQIECNQRLL
jgi:hypothetical protein